MPSSLTKQDLIDGVVHDTDCPKAHAHEVVQGIIDRISDVLSVGGTVTLRGFGTFSVRERKAGKGRNMHTGEAVSVPARKGVKFKPGTALRQALNGE